MKFDKRNVALASLVFGWISIFWNVYDQLIQSINTYSFALEPYESGWILAIDNIVGLLFCLFSATFRTDAKAVSASARRIFTSARRYLLSGCVLLAYSPQKGNLPRISCR